MGFSVCHSAANYKNQGVRVLSVSRQSGTDITDWQQQSRLGGSDVVYHLAAVAGVDVALEHPRETYNSNILGTLNILEYCRIWKVKRLVFASSYVYGPAAFWGLEDVGEGPRRDG